MRKTQPVSIRLPKAWLAILRRKSHEQSLATGLEIEYTDLIRTAIRECYLDVRTAEIDEGSSRDNC